jgi:hypothetical protein
MMTVKLTPKTETSKPLSLYQIEKICKENGYGIHRLIPVVGWCALYRFGFNWSMLTDITEYGVGLRYCYENRENALVDIQNWDGVGDPPGDWIKVKGYGRDDLNPRFMTDVDRELQLHDQRPE